MIWVRNRCAPSMSNCLLDRICGHGPGPQITEMWLLVKNVWSLVRSIGLALWPVVESTLQGQALTLMVSLIKDAVGLDEVGSPSVL